MKVLHTIGKRAQRFCYPLYFYPSQFKAKMIRSVRELQLAYTEMPAVQKA